MQGEKEMGIIWRSSSFHGVFFFHLFHLHFDSPPTLSHGLRYVLILKLTKLISSFLLSSSFFFFITSNTLYVRQDI